MNFELEDNEMKIFSEDEAMMSHSDLSKVSPLEEDLKPPPPPNVNSPKRKLSFREKFRRFTSPTPARKSVDESLKKPKDTFKDRLVCALSPESLRRKINKSSATASVASSTSSSDSGSPQKKKKLVSASTAKENYNDNLESKLDKETVENEVSNGLPLSPSINFIDAAMEETNKVEQEKQQGKCGKTWTDNPFQL